MDQQMVGSAAARLMDMLDKETKLKDGQIVAVGIVAIVEKDNSTYTRVMTTEDMYHRALGLFTEALNSVDGEMNEDDPDEEDEEELDEAE